MGFWIKVNGEWGEYRWVCADTGRDVLKLGVCLSGFGRKITYEDENGRHEIELTNIKTWQVIDPINNHLKIKK